MPQEAFDKLRNEVERHQIEIADRLLEKRLTMKDELRRVGNFPEAEIDNDDRSDEGAGKSNGQTVNGELGVIRKIEGCKFHIETESGRPVSVDVLKFRHLDHGYAVTSHSSQGQTVDRVIVNADTRESAALLNRRMAYVALSRAREDGLIFTNSMTELSAALDRRREKEMALESCSNQTSYRSTTVGREDPGPEMIRLLQHQALNGRPNRGLISTFHP